MGSFLSDMRLKLLDPLTIFIWFLASVLLCFLGPLGTLQTQSWLQRLIFWGLIAAAALVIGTSMRIVVDRRFGHLHYWRRGTMISSMVAVIYSPILFLLAEQFVDKVEGATMTIWQMAAIIFFSAMVITAIRRIHLVDVTDDPGTVSVPAEPEPPRLMNRLPECNRGPLIRIAVRDHYVDVVTEAGVTALLMRFSDALDEVQDTGGLRVHRSHWVVKAEVRGCERAGPRLFLMMSDGARVPVSKTYRAEVEAAGLA